MAVEGSLIPASATNAKRRPNGERERAFLMPLWFAEQPSNPPGSGHEKSRLGLRRLLRFWRFQPRVTWADLKHA